MLFTAFEPSGDDHAAEVILELRRRRPDIRVVAWGGRRMRLAGAEIIEHTGDDAVMGVPGLAKIREHRRINGRIGAWMDANRVDLLVPVDSPAANFPICAIARRHGVRVAHLVAPQIWAWGKWRIRKLRRLTDLVLCLLPFEEEYFRERGVPARFIGHMLFDRPLDFGVLDARAREYPAGEPRIAMMPGSRPAELERNLPILLDAFRLLRQDFPGAVGVVAATREPVAQYLRGLAERHGGWPQGLSIAAGETDAIVRWSQVALVKSGTVTLQVAKQARPMVIFYRKANPFVYMLAKTILSTKVFSLPNLIAGRRIVPELIPHFGGPRPIADIARQLLLEPEIAEQQRHELQQMIAKFSGMHAAELACDAIEEMLAGVAAGGPG